IHPEFLVIGAGVAGLRAAIELAAAGTVLVVAKDSLRESSSEYAQGGIAVALSDDDEVDLHEQDTLLAGDGLCNRAAVHTLAVEGAPRFLLSEALRGEGALLKNVTGQRFTEELAPRDVVARAIVQEMERTAAPNVFLDLTHRGEAFIRQRFPRIYETCLRYGV